MFSLKCVVCICCIVTLIFSETISLNDYQELTFQEIRELANDRLFQDVLQRAEDYFLTEYGKEIKDENTASLGRLVAAGEQEMGNGLMKYGLVFLGTEGVCQNELQWDRNSRKVHFVKSNLIGGQADQLLKQFEAPPK